MNLKQYLAGSARNPGFVIVPLGEDIDPGLLTVVSRQDVLGIIETKAKDNPGVTYVILEVQDGVTFEPALNWSRPKPSGIFIRAKEAN